MKAVLLVVGTIFTFGAVYQILKHPVQSSSSLLANAGDVNALEMSLTGA